MATTIRQVDRNQEKQNYSKAGESDFRIVPLAIIPLHAVQEHNEGKDGPAQLPKEEIGARNVIFQLRHHGRRAVHHHQAEADHRQDGEEQYPICFEPLRHLFLEQFCH